MNIIREILRLKWKEKEDNSIEHKKMNCTASASSHSGLEKDGVKE